MVHDVSVWRSKVDAFEATAILVLYEMKLPREKIPVALGAANIDDGGVGKILVEYRQHLFQCWPVQRVERLPTHFEPLAQEGGLQLKPRLLR